MKLMISSLLPILVTAACGGTAASPAEPGQGFQSERVHEAGHVKLWIPPGWAVDDSTADALVLSAPDHSVSLEVTLLEGKDLGAALLGVAATALLGYDNLQLVGSPRSAQVNGMEALFQDGRGNYHGTPVELSVGVIDTPAEKFLLIVGEAEQATFPEHAATIRQVMDGIKPL